MKFSFSPAQYFFTALLLFTGCTETVEPDMEAKSFKAIYDSRQFELEIAPIDVQQTADGGYLLLASLAVEDSQFPGAYLLKADKFGKFEKEMYVDAAITNPTGPLTLKDGKYYFLGMNSIDQSGLIIEVDPVLTTLNTVALEDLFYPMAYQYVDNLLLVLSYNNVAKTSVVSQVNFEGSSLIQQEFSIGAGDETEQPIIEHFFRTGRHFPFQVGKSGSGKYYFNGFYNYTFSLVVLNLNSDVPEGVVQGQQDDGGFSAIQPVGSNFAAARFDFGVNYLLPVANLSLNSITSASDLGGYVLPELISNSPIRIGRVQIDGKTVLLYGGDTQTRQIALFYYEESTGTLIGSRYLGFSNPFRLGSFTQTSDGGLVVSGITYLAGRFPRLCLFKLSAEELSRDLQ